MMMKVNMTDSSAVAGSILCRPGVARWHALFVSPQKEDQAEAWLQRRGVYSFHPVTTRKVIRSGRPREYHRRYLPGYVFARFPGEVLVHDVVACPFVQGALCGADGLWGVILPKDLRALHAMRKIDAELDRDRRLAARKRRKAQNLKKGDTAMFRSGAFVERTCEVVELVAEGGAKVRFQLFGREVLATARADDMVAISRSS